jgi:hypothetical protein
MLSVAAIVEILAYYIPGVDNLLDALATPAAFVAGTVVSAAVMTDVAPMVIDPQETLTAKFCCSAQRRHIQRCGS